MDADPIKDMLTAIRDAVCAVNNEIDANAIVTADLKRLIAARIPKAAERVEQLLFDGGPLQFPASVSVFWRPLMVGAGPSLDFVASQSCKEAEKALQTYCDTINIPVEAERHMRAAQALRMVHSGLPFILRCAGVHPSVPADSLGG